MKVFTSEYGNKKKYIFTPFILIGIFPVLMTYAFIATEWINHGFIHACKETWLTFDTSNGAIIATALLYWLLLFLDHQIQKKIKHIAVTWLFELILLIPTVFVWYISCVLFMILFKG